MRGLRDHLAEVQLLSDLLGASRRLFHLLDGTVKLEGHCQSLTSGCQLGLALTCEIPQRSTALGWTTRQTAGKTFIAVVFAQRFFLLDGDIQSWLRRNRDVRRLAEFVSKPDGGMQTIGLAPRPGTPLSRWQRGQHLREAMTEYRAYFIDLDGHFAGFEPMNCADDAEAIEQAKRLVERQGIELWSGTRLVIRLPRWAGD
jgi:hypothetical protein